MVEISNQKNNKVVRVSVKSESGNTPVIPNSNYTNYYANLAREWAIKMNGLVDKEDYSSKYYATQSKTHAETTESNLNSVIAEHEQITSEVTEAREDIASDLSSAQSTIATDLSNAQTSIATDLSGALSDMAVQKKAYDDNATEKTTALKKQYDTATADLTTQLNNATSEITEAKTTALNKINDTKNTVIEEVTEEGATQVDNIKQTGFYMQDGKLYYLDSEGNPQEFKSGGDTPENMVTTDTAQTITGAKVFNSTTGRTTFYAGGSSNYIQIGKDVSTDFPKGVITFGSTGAGVKGLKTNNSGDTFKISSAGHTIIQSTGQTYITTGVSASSKNGIYLPPNAASYGSVSIWGGATASNSTNGADGQLQVGLEGNGTYYNRKGVFIETTKNRKLWLGQMNYRSSIEAGTSSSLGSQYVQINTNPDTSDNACLTLSKNKLTYYTADGTEHDLLAGGSTEGLADTNLSNITDAGKQVIKDTVGMQPQAFNYGMSQYFQYGDHMDNASWLIADGQWNDGETYSGLYNWAEEQLQAGTDDFIAGTENDEIDSEYYFVVDTTNKKFKLPTMNGSENLVSTVAEDMNITSSPFTYTAPANGWLYMSGTADSNVNQFITVYIDKKKTMPIIGRNPLTQASITYLVPVRRNQEVEIQYTATNISRCKFIYAEGNGTLYYYAGNTIQNADLIDIGKITNSLATKLDTSLSNITEAGKQVIKDMTSSVSIATTTNLGIVKPDGTTITVTDGVISSNTYTKTEIDEKIGAIETQLDNIILGE